MGGMVLGRIIIRLTNVQVQNLVLNLWLWLDGISGSYTTKSTYMSCFHVADPGPLNDTLYKIWHLKIPAKYAFLVWCALRDRLPTGDNLRRNIISEDPKLICPFYQNHCLTFYCSVMWLVRFGMFVNYGSLKILQL